MNTKSKLLTCVVCILLLTAWGWRRTYQVAATDGAGPLAASTDGDSVSLAGAKDATGPAAPHDTVRAAAPDLAPAQGACQLRVLDADSLTPVSGASIDARDESGTGHVLSLDPRGCVVLPRLGVWHLIVTAPEHVRREFVGQVEPGELVFLLEAGGTIEVTVRSESGVAVAGAEVVLVPPLAGESAEGAWRDWTAQRVDSPKLRRFLQHVARVQRQVGAPFEPLTPDPDDTEQVVAGGVRVSGTVLEALPADAWRATTDSAGRAHWSGLPTLADFRVAWIGPGRAKLSPPNEFKPYHYKDGKWVATGRAIEDLTGALVVRAGQSTNVEAVAYRESSVFGWIDSRGASLRSPSVVKLFHRSIEVSGDGADLETVLVESSVVPSMDGQFEFHNVRPGRKRIAAHWSPKNGLICFASIDFEVAPSETREIGVLSAQPGFDLTIRTALTTPDGTELAASDVFVDGVRAEVALGLDTLLDSRDTPGAISEMIGVPLGESVVLSGLPPGQTYLSARFGGDYDLRESDGSVSISEPRDRTTSSSTTQPELLAFVVTRRIEQRLQILWTQAGPPPRMEAYWRSKRTGQHGQADLSPPHRVVGPAEYSLLLAEGEYELLVHAQTLEAPRDDAGWLWSGTLKVSPASDTPQILLQEGSALEGRVLDARGGPIARRPISLALPEWGTPEAPHWMYTVITDEDGRFRFCSLPADVELNVSTGGAPIRTGPAGATRTVELRRAR